MLLMKNGLIIYRSDRTEAKKKKKNDRFSKEQSNSFDTTETTPSQSDWKFSIGSTGCDIGKKPQAGNPFN